MPDSIKKLTDLFAKFPTVGQRTAGRFVFYLINLPKPEVDALMLALGELKNNITFCAFCFNPHEGTQNLCDICSNAARNMATLCVVEKESDLLSIENTKKFKGLYFVLGSNALSLRKIVDGNLRLEELKKRIEAPQKFGVNANFTEIIVATNPTPEGRATSVLILRALKELPQFTNLKITHLGQGLPVGGELEYADEETLESAFEGRK